MMLRAGLAFDLLFGVWLHIQGMGEPPSRMTPQEVLAMAERVKSSQFATTKCSLDLPLTSAAISVVESGGVENAYRYEAHLNEGSAGLCQMLLSTAVWLANDMGYTAHGRTITVRLSTPGAAVAASPATAEATH